MKRREKEKHLKHIIKKLKCDRQEAEMVYINACKEASTYNSPLEFCIQLVIYRLCGEL